MTSDDENRPKQHERHIIWALVSLSSFFRVFCILTNDLLGSIFLKWERGALQKGLKTCMHLEPQVSFLSFFQLLIFIIDNMTTTTTTTTTTSTRQHTSTTTSTTFTMS